MPLEGLSFVKTLATFGIINATDSSHVVFDFQARRTWTRAEIVKCNGIYRLFPFSKVLARHKQNFGMKFRKMSVPIRSHPGISGILVEWRPQ